MSLNFLAMSRALSRLDSLSVRPISQELRSSHSHKAGSDGLFGSVKLANRSRLCCKWMTSAIFSTCSLLGLTDPPPRKVLTKYLSLGAWPESHQMNRYTKTGL